MHHGGVVGYVAFTWIQDSLGRIPCEIILTLRMNIATAWRVLDLQATYVSVEVPVFRAPHDNSWNEIPI